MNQPIPIDISGRHAEIAAFVDSVGQQTGRRPLSDEMWIRLQSPDQHTSGIVSVSANGAIDGYAQLVVGADPQQTAMVEVVFAAPSVVDQLIDGVLQKCAQVGVSQIRWWAFEPAPQLFEVAKNHRFMPERALLQMRRPLPVDIADGDKLVTRPFVVGRDETAWLATNNAAFHWHPEQGGWTIEQLHLRQREEWFDPSGFLLHEIGGTLAGFCWTKLHADEQPTVGEIYVIAVDPAFHGRGLGRALTLAGLRSLHNNGATIGMLHVDESNTAAVGLYRQLGFVTTRTDQSFIRQIPTSADTADRAIGSSTQDNQ